MRKFQQERKDSKQDEGTLLFETNNQNSFLYRMTHYMRNTPTPDSIPACSMNIQVINNSEFKLQPQKLLDQHLTQNSRTKSRYRADLNVRIQ